MKALNIILIATCINFNFIYSQQANHFGAKLGPSLSNFYGNDAGKSKDKLGFNAGLFYQKLLSKNWTLQPELYITSKGATYKNSGTNISCDLFYLEAPVLMKYSWHSIYFIGGTGFSLNFYDKLNISSLSSKAYARKLDLILVIGIAKNISDRLGIEIRYVGSVLPLRTGSLESSKYNGVFSSALEFSFR